MKIRIAFVNGIWQLCMVIAGFYQEQKKHPEVVYKDILVLYARKTSSMELVEFVEEKSYKFWNWHGVIKINWTVTEWDQQIDPINTPIVNSILLKFKIDKTSSVDQIWLCKLQFVDERFFADIFYKADIFLYEDGLHSYGPANYLIELPSVDFLSPINTLRNCKRSINKYFLNHLDWQHKGVKRKHLRRIKIFYSVLGDQLPLSPVFKGINIEVIEPKRLQAIFSELYYHLQVQSNLSSRNQKALFLGSNLSHLNSFPRHIEVAAFSSLIQELIERDYTIFWKEHPRNKVPLFQDIKQIIPHDRLKLLSEEQKIPVEVLISNEQFDLCCSSLSSSLFYLKHIYDIKTLTCIRPLMPYLKGDFLALSELTILNIDEII